MKKSQYGKILGITISAVLLVLILSVLNPTLGIENKTISEVNTYGYGYGYGYGITELTDSTDQIYSEDILPSFNEIYPQK
ncbi:MAG: hypothetical protein MUO82_06000 [Candidatus Thermoplasmatota archaeon]|nr:hypothetical protein [Candidatus Thermoplasmatota archaeon]